LSDDAEHDDPMKSFCSLLERCKRMRTALCALLMSAMSFGSLAACSGERGASSDRDEGDGSARDVGAADTATRDGPALDGGVDGPFVVGKHAPFPQISGRSVLGAPSLVTVTFPDDPLAPKLEAFAKELQTSAYWTTVTAPYCDGDGGPCIGPGSAPVAITYPSPAASLYVDIPEEGVDADSGVALQPWLLDAIEAGVLPAPAPGIDAGLEDGVLSDTVYLLYFPPETTIESGSSTSCTDFVGYHYVAQYGDTWLVYAVLPECPPSPPNVAIDVTVAASHEIVEAVTDPMLDGSGGYCLSPSPGNIGWIDATDVGEAADLCEFDIPNTWSFGSYSVQRIWSNANASLGHDPCAPVPTDDAYFNASPETSYFVMDVGSSVTFDVDAFSTTPRDDWTLAVYDWTNWREASSPYLSFSIVGGKTDSDGVAAIQVNNGSRVKVNMTLLQDPPLSTYPAAYAGIVSYTGPASKPTELHPWMIGVTTPEYAVGGTDAGP
jgi:hypothetical protein